MPHGLPAASVEALSALERGVCFAHTGRLAEAADEFAAALSRAGGDLRVRSCASTNLAAVHREAGRFEEAAAWQQVALSAASTDCGDALPSSADQANVEIDPADLAGLANDALLRDEYEFCERLFSLSLTAELRRGNLRGAADDLGGLGIVALLQGRETQALARLWRAYRMHRNVEDAEGAGRDLLNLAEACRRRNHPRIAFRCLRTAVRQFEGCGAAHLAERARVQLDDAIRIAEVPRRNPLAN